MLAFPFNFNPNSISVKTSAYPIPAGRYAIVTAEVSKGGTFTIDGFVALKSQPGTKTKVTFIGSDYDVPADKYFEGIVKPSGTSANVVVGGYSSPGFDFTKLGPGESVDNDTAGGAPGVAVIGVLSPVDPESNSETATFYVPTGATISGTGDWRATVSEFIIPT